MSLELVALVDGPMLDVVNVGAPIETTGICTLTTSLSNELPLLRRFDLPLLLRH